MLAEAMPTVSRDGLAYTFKLRQGIKFHNGKEMTVRGRGRLAQAVGQAVDLRQGPVQRRSPTSGRRQVHRRAEAQGEVRRSSDLPGGARTTSPPSIRRRSPRSSRRQRRSPSSSGPAPSSSPSGSPTSTSGWSASTTTSPGARSPTATAARKIAYVDEIRWIPVPDVATRVAQMETGRARVRRRPERRTPTTG